MLSVNDNTKTAVTMKKTPELLKRTGKSNVTLRNFLNNLKENDLHYENKQITQCVFLGVLRLKPVPSIFTKNLSCTATISAKSSSVSPSTSTSTVSSNSNKRNTNNNSNKIVNKNVLKRKKPPTSKRNVNNNKKTSPRNDNGNNNTKAVVTDPINFLKEPPSLHPEEKLNPVELLFERLKKVRNNYINFKNNLQGDQDESNVPVHKINATTVPKLKKKFVEQQTSTTKNLRSSLIDKYNSTIVSQDTSAVPSKIQIVSEMDNVGKLDRKEDVKCRKKLSTASIAIQVEVPTQTESSLSITEDSSSSKNSALSEKRCSPTNQISSELVKDGLFPPENDYNNITKSKERTSPRLLNKSPNKNESLNTPVSSNIESKLNFVTKPSKQHKKYDEYTIKKESSPVSESSYKIQNEKTKKVKQPNENIPKKLTRAQLRFILEQSNKKQTEPRKPMKLEPESESDQNQTNSVFPPRRRKISIFEKSPTMYMTKSDLKKANETTKIPHEKIILKIVNSKILPNTSEIIESATCSKLDIDEIVEKPKFPRKRSIMEKSKTMIFIDKKIKVEQETKSSNCEENINTEKIKTIDVSKSEDGAKRTVERVLRSDIPKYKDSKSMSKDKLLSAVETIPTLNEITINNNKLKFETINLSPTESNDTLSSISEDDKNNYDQGSTTFKNKKQIDHGNISPTTRNKKNEVISTITKNADGITKTSSTSKIKKSNTNSEVVTSPVTSKNKKTQDDPEIINVSPSSNNKKVEDEFEAINRSPSSKIKDSKRIQTSVSNKVEDEDAAINRSPSPKIKNSSANCEAPICSTSKNKKVDDDCEVINGSPTSKNKNSNFAVSLIPVNKKSSDNETSSKRKTKGSSEVISLVPVNKQVNDIEKVNTSPIYKNKRSSNSPETILIASKSKRSIGTNEQDVQVTTSKCKKIIAELDSSNESTAPKVVKTSKNKKANGGPEAIQMSTTSSNKKISETPDGSNAVAKNKKNTTDCGFKNEDSDANSESLQVSKNGKSGRDFETIEVPVDCKIKEDEEASRLSPVPQNNKSDNLEAAKISSFSKVQKKITKLETTIEDPSSVKKKRGRPFKTKLNPLAKLLKKQSANNKIFNKCPEDKHPIGKSKEAIKLEEKSCKSEQTKKISDKSQMDENMKSGNQFPKLDESKENDKVTKNSSTSTKEQKLDHNKDGDKTISIISNSLLETNLAGTEILKIKQENSTQKPKQDKQKKIESASKNNKQKLKSPSPNKVIRQTNLKELFQQAAARKEPKEKDTKIAESSQNLKDEMSSTSSNQENNCVEIIPIKSTPNISNVKNETSVPPKCNNDNVFTVPEMPKVIQPNMMSEEDEDYFDYDSDSGSKAEWMPEDYAEYKFKYSAKKMMKTKSLFTCKICLMVLPSYFRLNKHRLEHYHDPNPYMCNQCHQTFAVFEELTAHIRVHKGKHPYSCKKCNKGFWTKKALENHLPVHVLRKVKPPEKRFRCDVCAKEFSKLCDMERHTRVHTGEKPCVCNICNKRYQQSHNLRKHLLTHLHLKPFQCEICNKQFGRNDVLNRHLLTHSVEKPFKCTECLKDFIRQTQLSHHMAKYHNI